MNLLTGPCEENWSELDGSLLLDATIKNIWRQQMFLIPVLNFCSHSEKNSTKINVVGDIEF